MLVWGYTALLVLTAGFETKMIKDYDLTDIYKANDTDLQPSKILTFSGDPFHDGTQTVYYSFPCM
jgi:hypothetical protein